MERHEILSVSVTRLLIALSLCSEQELSECFWFSTFLFSSLDSIFILLQTETCLLLQGGQRSKVMVSYKSADRGSVSHLRTLLADFSQSGGLKNKTLQTNKRPVFREKTQQPRNKTENKVKAIKRGFLLCASQQQNQLTNLKLIGPTTSDVTVINVSQQLSSKSVWKLKNNTDGHQMQQLSSVSAAGNESLWPTIKKKWYFLQNDAQNVVNLCLFLFSHLLRCTNEHFMI